eukprot:Polyplicarium_translucidae@DN3324_c1_g1_i8.p2
MVVDVIVVDDGKQLPVIRAMGMSWALSRRRVAVLEMTCMRYHTVSQCMSCMRYDTLSHAAMGSAVGIDFPQLEGVLLHPYARREERIDAADCAACDLRFAVRSCLYACINPCTLR